jgi:hypothetical protein
MPEGEEFFFNNYIIRVIFNARLDEKLHIQNVEIHVLNFVIHVHA